MMTSLDDNIGRVLDELAALGLEQRHDRRLHQRQRRRAVLRHLAVHRQEDRAARRRPARAGDRALARPRCGGTASAAASIISMDWLPTSGGRRRRAGPRLPERRREPAARADRARRSARSRSCSGATRQGATTRPPCAPATGNTCASAGAGISSRLRARLPGRSANCSANKRATGAADCPVSTGSRFPPTLGSFGSGRAGRRKERRQPVHRNRQLIDRSPAGMRAGQLASSGTRMPPSSNSPFMPLNGHMSRTARRRCRS